MVIRTPDRRLRVFISSALQELADERRAASEAVGRLRLTPVMFEQGARPHAPRKLYRAYLDQSDVFVGIYWQDYGWVAPGETVSGLEDEYRLAGGRPRLIYIKSPAPDRDPRLGTLLERIRDDDQVSYRKFGSAAELRELIENDLAVLLTERFEHSSGGERGMPAGGPATNLPVPRNPLIGREQLLADACQLLRRDDSGLVTLVGPGGSGKSRLALQVALDLLDDFEDGAFLVGLESVRDPDLVMSTIAHTIPGPAPGDPAGSPTVDLLGYLRAKRMLLLLDNFEQVVAAAPSISALLEACPRLKVLVTSRAPLRVRAERELPVPPLSLPVPGSGLDAERLSAYSAVRLFIERAKGVKPDFIVTNETAPAVAEICDRLDGLPLAIELAAARVKILPPPAMLARLERRLDVLRGGARDLPERQHTMRAAIGWSYDLLDEDAKAVFRRLAVFPSTWSLDAAEAVCSAPEDPHVDILGAMENLVGNSLLTRPTTEDGLLRCGMLETIREYGRERLADSGETDAVRRRQAEFYVELVERAEPEMKSSGQAQWGRRLEVEHHNIRAVLAWSLENDVGIGLRLSGALWRFWEGHNYIGEARSWLEASLAASQPGTPGRAKVLRGAAAIASYQGDYDVARRHSEEALAISRLQEDRVGIAAALNELGLTEVYRGAYESAREHLEQSLEIKRELGLEWLMANSTMNLGLVAGYQRDYASAYARHEEALAMFRAQGDALGVAIASGNLGHVAMRLGRLDVARTLQSRSLKLFDEVGDLDGMAESLDRFAMLAVAEADLSRATTLFGAADRLREAAGTSLPPAERDELHSEIDALRARLGEDFETGWLAGRGMSKDAALALASEPGGLP